MDIGYKSTAGADVIIKILLWCLIFAKWLAVIYEVMILQWTSLPCNKGEQARKRGLWKSSRTSLPLSCLALTVNLTQPRASWQRASAEDAELPGSDWPARGRGGGSVLSWCIGVGGPSPLWVTLFPGWGILECTRKLTEFEPVWVSEQVVFLCDFCFLP